jgi:hypothetical protein
MATLQVRNGSYRVLFRHRGKRYSFTVGAVAEREAELAATAAERVLLRVKQNLLTVPPGVGIVDFVNCDGRPPRPDEPAAQPVVTFRTLKDKYLETYRNGAMEANSLATVEMHLNHVEKVLGSQFPLADLSLPDLQRYVNARAGKVLGHQVAGQRNASG